MVPDPKQETRPMPVLIGVLVLAVLLVFGLAGAGQPEVSARRVLVVGDSLTEISKNEVRQALTAAGWRAVVDGRGGLSIGLWRPFVGGDTRFTRPDVAVVELGTNDCDLSCRPLAPDIDAIVKKLLDEGVHAIVWLNVQQDSPYPEHPQFVNQEIERAAVRWPQLSIVDLNRTFAGHPEWHAEDGIHFNEAGRLVYAQLILQALDAFPDAR
jgi:lysophospholipase L1-like esterase